MRHVRTARLTGIGHNRLTTALPLALLAMAGCKSDDSAGSTDLAVSASIVDGGADAAPVGPCGPVTFTAGTGLRRHPYLQSITTTTARVAWTTTTQGAGLVRVRPASGGPSVEVAAAREAFPKARTDVKLDFSAYVADLSGLSADTDYCYELVEDGVVLGGGLALHTAWPADKARPLRILAFGDSGTGLPPQLLLRDQMKRHAFDVFLHLGDIAYTDGTWDQLERFFFDVYRDLLHGVPVYPAIGNHEYHTQNGQPFVDVYYLFEQAMRSVDQERYYSFDYGDVHFVTLDSNPEMLDTVDSSATDDMVDWLRADLARSKATWKIVLFHHPAWSSGEHGSSSGVQEKVVPALEEGGVDLVLNGHDHHYERTVPIWQGARSDADRRAITYVVAGAGGAPNATPAGAWFTAASDAKKWSFLKLVIDGCTATGETLAHDGKTIDSFTLDGCEP